MAKRKPLSNRILQILILTLMLALLFITWPDKAAHNSLRHKVKTLNSRVSDLEVQVDDSQQIKP